MNSREVASYIVGFCCGFLLFCNQYLELNYSHVPESTQTIEFQGNGNLNGTCLADDLFESVKVLCLVLTYPANHKRKARHVKATWGKRCNKLYFITLTADPDLPTILVDVPEGRDYLWDKARDAFEFVYKNHFDDFDWFLKADDDSYMVMENVRQLLYSYDTSTSLYIGHKNYIKGEKGFASGAGYVLSKAALKDLVEKALKNDEKCRIGWKGVEDAVIGYCLANYSSFVGTLDEKKQQRFLPFGVKHHFEKDRDWNHWYFRPWYMTPWFWNHLYYNIAQGSLDCCSDSFGYISYVESTEMYLLDYLIYKVVPFGVDRHFNETLPRKWTFDEVERDANEKSFQEQNPLDYHY